MGHPVRYPGRYPLRQESRKDALQLIPSAFKTKWFWWSVFCVACWVPWIFFSKLGSVEINSRTMQFLFNMGSIPLAIVFLIARKFRFEKTRKGITYGLIVGILSAVGQLAMFEAYRDGSNASVVTVLTSLYPVVTVALAFVVLRERLSKTQTVGLVFALAAMALFSL